jgi:Ni2+-binding GTPase involved in maturation of urease and hydrogenase
LPSQNANLRVKITLPKVCQNYRHVDISGTVRTGKEAIIEKILDGIKKHKDWFSDKLDIVFKTEEQFNTFINQTRQELTNFIEFLE